MGRVRVRRYVVALTVAYLAAVAVIVTSPWGWELNRLTVRLWAFFLDDLPTAPSWTTPEHYGVLLNVLLFVPIGVLLSLATRRPWWAVVVVALVGSSVIELVQWRWLARQGSWDDVVANTVGALIGAVAVTLLARAGSSRAGRPGPPRRD